MAEQIANPRQMFFTAATVLALAIAAPADTSPHAVWTVSATKAAVADTISAWLALTGPKKQRITIELQSNSAVTVWFTDSASVGGCRYPRPTRTDIDSVSKVLHVCAAARVPGAVRLVAVVTRGPVLQPVAAEAAASEAIAIEPPEDGADLPAWAIALITSVSGFLAGLLLQWAQQRSQRKAKIDDEERAQLKAKDGHRHETERLLTRLLASDIAANVPKLRDVVADRPPQILSADASTLFAEKERGLFAYLGEEGAHAVNDLTYLYMAISAYNQLRNALFEERTAGQLLPARKQQLIDGMKRQAHALLAMLENPHQDAKGRSETIKAITSQILSQP